MAINFPNTPTDGQVFSSGTTSWIYSSSNGSWTVSSATAVSLDNAINHDTEVSHLQRTGSVNVLVPAVGLTFDKTNRTLAVKANPSQTEAMLKLTDSGGGTINSFNKRGVLENAGKVYLQSSAPTPHADDPGILWVNTSNDLKVWNGTTFNDVGVNLGGNQTITGAKTLSNTNLFLSGTSAIKGQGASKSLAFYATNSTPTDVLALTLSSSAATFSVPVELSAIGTTAKTVLCDIASTQTITGAKTFSGGLTLSGSFLLSSGILAASSATTSGATTSNIVISPSSSTASRRIKIDTNSSSSGGIDIKATNDSGSGSLTVTGNTTITGNLNVVGSFVVSAGGAVANCTYGSFKSSGTAVYNITTAPASTLGPLTISSSIPSLTFANTSPYTVTFYIRREQYNTNTSTGGHVMSIKKYVLTPGATGIGVNLATSASATGTGVTETLIASSGSAGFSLTATETQDRPLFFTISLGV